nr:AEC family transporter [Terribacillus saccharophilus]
MAYILTLLPIFGIFLLGFVGQKLLKFDIRSISKMSVYLLSPVLAFQTFYENRLSTDYIYLAIFVVGICLALVLICYVISLLRGFNRQDTYSLMLGASFMNNGNYGTPLVLFVFGAAGFDYAVILLVLQRLVMVTIGVFIATKGGGAVLSPRATFLSVLKIPIIYGAILGILFQVLSIPLSGPITEAVHLVADATIPTVMIVLGMRLANISLKSFEYERLTYALVLKLLISPVIAYLFTLMLPVDDMVKQIMILVAAMPTAANTTLYALEFGAKPAYVSSATLISTLLSLITLPVLLYILL